MRDARCPGPSTQDLLARDARPAPPLLRESAEALLGSGDLPTEAYTSQAFCDREIEKVWRRTWQAACREEDIPRVGDHVVYDVADDSLIVVRAAPGEIRAHHNACLHRGTRLRDKDGTAALLRCPFHGFTWNLDGTLRDVPCRWDFPHVRDAAFRLPEAKVATWGGFVFVNLDPAAPPLEDYLEDLPRHFERWALERRFKALHVGKEVACNWKVALEAFLEVFHIAAVHPDAVGFFADVNSQYDVFPGQRHWSRMLNVSGVPSPLVRARSDEQSAYDAASRYGMCPPAQVPEGRTARELLSEATRERLARDLGLDASAWSDSEVLDVIEYNLFPNLMLFGGFSPLCYRVRPAGRDPGRCLFEVMLLVPLPDGAPRPPAAKARWLREDERFADVAELTFFGPVLDEDMTVMPLVQRGLRASRKPGITLGNYQEVRIRHLRRTLDAYLRA
jgi:phenylpropionate dioxygenase-like ring-hydroxylating dioxygenase large terminal subunit